VYWKSIVKKHHHHRLIMSEPANETVVPKEEEERKEVGTQEEGTQDEPQEPQNAPSTPEDGKRCNIFSEVGSGVVSGVTSVGSGVVSGVTSVGSVGSSVGSGVATGVDSVGSGVSTVTDTVTSGVSTVTGVVTSGVSNIVNAVVGMFSPGRKLEQRPLGSAGLVVSAQGLGCMGMTAFYHDSDPTLLEDSNQECIKRALELGINFFDTAWIYQSFGKGGFPNQTNEALLGRAIKIHGRDKFIIATKFGIVPTLEGTSVPNSAEACIRAQVQDSLTRLGIETIDLYYQHRPDPTVPIEDVIGTLKKLITEGKIRYIGLSECSADELRRANAVHPITAIQMEWSLQSREIEENGILATARELGVGIVAYSPLGRGFLTAK
jgi:aryl-alcohol dehydrogenase-like predicted oxidoreductase